MSIKSTIKNNINSGSLPCYEELIEKCKHYSYVSFDIFDTLLKRKVSRPTDVFDLISCKVSKKFSNFKFNRIEAEKRARILSDNEEVSLAEIYKQYPQINDIERSYLEKVELSIEREVLVGNKPIVKLFNKLKELGIQINLISDMYLPKNFIENVLVKNNIIGYKALYVSSDKKHTKKSGKLFYDYLKDERISPKCAVHIGDSWVSDYIVPQKLGISAIHIPTNVYENNRFHSFNSTHLNTNYLSNFLKYNKPNTDDDYELFGYYEFGPFLWGYVNWLHSQFKKENIEKVYFFSRDGYIMRRAYNLLFENDHSISNYYLEVSRRSLRVPVLWMNTDYEEFINMLSPSKLVSIKSIFDGVGLNIKKYKKILNKYNFTLSTTFDKDNIYINANLKKMYKDLLPDIISNSKNEYRLLNKYLKENNVQGKFAIVDIGWGGSMERYLTTTLNKLNIPNNIYGYYIGVADYFTKNVKLSDMNMRGYLFDFKNSSNAKDLRSSFVGLFESLFLEQDGSVEKYKSINDKIYSQRYPYEYLSNKGKPSFELKSIEKVQKGALYFINLVKRDSILSTLLNFKPQELYLPLYLTGTRPDKLDLKLFADFKFYDEGRADKLANPKSISKYIKNRSSLKRDFLNSRWKIGFMKKLFKLNLPYQRLYNVMHKFK